MLNISRKFLLMFFEIKLKLFNLKIKCNTVILNNPSLISFTPFRLYIL